MKRLEWKQQKDMGSFMQNIELHAFRISNYIMGWSSLSTLGTMKKVGSYMI
jgi:hypothetical protein